MPRDDLKKRIEALNKRPLQNVLQKKEDPAPEVAALRRKLSKQSAKPKAVASTTPVFTQTPAPTIQPKPIMQEAPSRTIAPPRDFGPAVTLEEVADGAVVDALNGPGYFLIEKEARELEEQAAIIHKRFVQLTGYPDGEAVERICRVCESSVVEPESVLFMDLETTGLSMTPVFLIGTMECGPNGFIFRQYFARDYSEEMSILSAISPKLANTGLLVTFNGKSFDVPFLENRGMANGVRLTRPKAHIDLLHESRRLYRGELPNCRLQTLERMICERCREDDIPGSEIPEAYHDFIRTGNANKIGLILLHNLYDLLTMADLMHRMWRTE